MAAEIETFAAIIICHGKSKRFIIRHVESSAHCASLHTTFLLSLSTQQKTAKNVDENYLYKNRREYDVMLMLMLSPQKSY